MVGSPTPLKINRLMERWRSVHGSVEVRYRPFRLLGDAIHLLVGTRITTHDIFFSAEAAKRRIRAVG
jgi:hypothetical protein